MFVRIYGALHRCVLLALSREPWWAEFWSAATAVTWAVLSYLSLEGMDRWRSMQVLVEIGDDRFWHVLGFGLGVFQLVVLVFSHRWLRWGAALAQGWFWGVLTLGVWVATPWSPAVAVYAGWCGINVCSVLRLLRPPSVTVTGREQR